MGKSKRLISLVYPYYEAPRMFVVHQQLWNEWPQEILDQVEVCMVDDGSPSYPARDFFDAEAAKFKFRLARITVDVPWNEMAARNLGAHLAEGAWLFMTDMDLAVPLETITYLLNGIKKGELHPQKYYSFARVNMPDMEPYHDHPNTFFLTKNLFWSTGGYNETGWANMYGGDGPIIRLLDRNSLGRVRLGDLKVIRYLREQVKDCSVNMPRKEGRDEKRLEKLRQQDKQILLGIIPHPPVLTFPWEEVI